MRRIDAGRAAVRGPPCCYNELAAHGSSAGGLLVAACHVWALGAAAGLPSAVCRTEDVAARRTVALWYAVLHTRSTAGPAQMSAVHAPHAACDCLPRHRCTEPPLPGMQGGTFAASACARARTAAKHARWLTVQRTALRTLSATAARSSAATVTCLSTSAHLSSCLVCRCPRSLSLRLC